MRRERGRFVSERIDDLRRFGHFCVNLSLFAAMARNLERSASSTMGAPSGSRSIPALPAMRIVDIPIPESE